MRIAVCSGAGAEVGSTTEFGETALTLAADRRTAQLLGGSAQRAEVSPARKNRN